jgi:hypothetical protein
MAEKKVWISAVEVPEKNIRHLMGRLKRYGIQAGGHLWVDDLAKYAWKAAEEPLGDAATSAWVIAASAAALARPETHYGLSLLAVRLQARRGSGFPIFILALPDGTPAAGRLGTPLAGASIFPLDAPGVEAKLLARIHAAVKPAPVEYHLDVYGHEQAGQWFEASPASGAWPGVILGAAGAVIDMHAVGPRGKLPQKAVLEHPLKGLRLNSVNREFQAWAAMNTLSPAESYFVRIQGRPEALVFGPYAAGEQAELFVVRLC